MAKSQDGQMELRVCYLVLLLECALFHYTSYFVFLRLSFKFNVAVYVYAVWFFVCLLFAVALITSYNVLDGLSDK